MGDSGTRTPRAPRLYPPFVGPGDELPLIDDFLEDVRQADAAASDESDDDLPSIGEFLAGEPELDADGWAVASWQSYDWNGLASSVSHIISPERAEADAAWTATDWSSGGVAARHTPEAQAAFNAAHPTAREVAVALDAIARRIRSGGLSIDQFRGTPPEAALAAALAAMLKLRR